MYYALNRGQTDARTFECVRLVQALKDTKQFIYVLHIKAYSVVPNEYYQVALVAVGASDLYFSLLARAYKFNCVGYKVNQHKPQHRTVAIEVGQCTDFP